MAEILVNGVPSEHAPSLVLDVVAGQLVPLEQGLCDSSTQRGVQPTTSGASETVPEEVGRSRQKIVRKMISEREFWGFSEVVPKAPLPNTSSNNQGSVGDAHVQSRGDCGSRELGRSLRCAVGEVRCHIGPRLWNMSHCVSTK